MTNIELIKAGKLAIKDNCKDATRKVLHHIWPTDGDRLRAEGIFYYQSPTVHWYWNANGNTNLHTILATDLLKEIEQAEWKPKRGELVEVGDGNHYIQAKYFGIGNEEYPFLCERENGQIYSYKFIRPLPTKHKVTQSTLLAEYAKAKGIEVSQIEITD